MEGLIIFIWWGPEQRAPRLPVAARKGPSHRGLAHITDREAHPGDRRGDGQRASGGLRWSSSFLAQTNDLPEYQGNLQMLTQILLQEFWRNHGELEAGYLTKCVIPQMGGKCIFSNYSWQEATWCWGKRAGFGTRKRWDRISGFV